MKYGKFWGILAIVLVFAMAFAGCNNDTTSDENGKDNGGNVINNNPKTITITGLDNSWMEISVFLRETSYYPVFIDLDLDIWGSENIQIQSGRAEAPLWTGNRWGQEQDIKPWTGSGSWHVMFGFNDPVTYHSIYYVSRNPVNFNTANPSIQFSENTFKPLAFRYTFNEIEEMGWYGAMMLWGHLQDG